MDTPKALEKLEFIHFLTEHVHMCFDIQYLEKIVQLVELRQLPGGPGYLAGLMNLEGRSIPIIDLALRLGLPRTKKYSLNTPIILCHNKTQNVGIIVDKILGLTSIDKNTFQLEPSFSDPASPFSAVTTIGNKLALVLNIHQLLAIQFMAERNIPHFDINSIDLTGFKYE